MGYKQRMGILENFLKKSLAFFLAVIYCLKLEFGSYIGHGGEGHTLQTKLKASRICVLASMQLPYQLWTDLLIMFSILFKLG